MAASINLYGLSIDELEQFISKFDSKSIHVKRVMQALYQDLSTNINEFHTLPKKLKQALSHYTTLDLPKVIRHQHALDGTQKWLIALSANDDIETVYIPQATRGTLCLSSQVGCALKCRFCATGKQGFRRNLTLKEIIAQLIIAKRTLKMMNLPLTNVVFMGMGEPLLNEQAVYAATELLIHDWAFGLSRRRVTISTAGIVPAIYRVARRLPVSLAVSLHSARDELRTSLLPINRKYPLDALLNACRYYLASGTHKRHIFFEYVMLDQINDSVADALALIDRLNGIAAKVNLIPFNTFSNAPYRSSTQATIKRFSAILRQHKIRVTMRGARGADIASACGQLVAQAIN